MWSYRVWKQQKRKRTSFKKACPFLFVNSNDSQQQRRRFQPAARQGDDRSCQILLNHRQIPLAQPLLQFRKQAIDRCPIFSVPMYWQLNFFFGRGLHPCAPTRCIWIAAGRSWWIRCSIMPNVSDAPRRILWLRTAAIVRRMQCMGGI